MVSHQPADETTLRASNSSPIFQNYARDAAVLDRQPFYRASQLQFTAQRTKLSHKVL